jgi:hypothetical protein
VIEDFIEWLTDISLNFLIACFFLIPALCAVVVVLWLVRIARGLL